MKTFLSCLCIVTGFTVSAQTTGTIMGTITTETGSPVSVASVIFKTGTGTLGAVSDTNGRYAVRNVPFGTYELEFRAMGYITLIKSDVKVSSGSITYVNANLSIKEGPGVEIVHEIWRDSVIRKGLPPLLIPIDAEALTRSGGGRTPGELMETFIPRVSRNAAGGLNFSGSRSGSTLYLVDGVKVLGEEPHVPNQGIAELNVYIGGIPAQYGDTTSGVVIINTKSYH